MALAAGDDAGTLRQRIGDMFFNLRHRIGIDQRALRDARFHPGANLQPFYRCLQLGGKGFVNAILHQDAIGADAGLPRIAIFGRHGTLHGRIQIRIVKHNEGRITAQFHGGFLNGRGALREQHTANFRRTREGKLADDRVAGEFLACLARRPGDHIADAGRHARTFRQYRQGQRRKGRLRCGADHAGAACSPTRTGLAGDHGRREIPRRDGGENAYWFLGHQNAAPLGVLGNRFPLHAAAFIGEPFNEGCGINHLALRFRERLALFRGHDRGQIVGIFMHQRGDFVQDHSTIFCQHRAPGRPGGIGGFNGAAGFRLAHGGHFANHLTGCGVAHGNHLAAIGLHPGAGDVIRLTEKGGVLQGQLGGCVEHLGPPGLSARIG